MQKKGGAYTLIETMLLIGFVIASTFAVYSWAKSRAKEDTTKVISSVASSLECADIKITASCDENTVLVNNTGLHTIKKMLVRWINDGQNEGQSSLLEIELKPSMFISSTDYADLSVGREIVPVVEIEDRFYLCQEKGVTISC